MQARTAVVVAGGRGTRLQPLTHDLPKPLVPFCGEPFLAGVVRRLAAAGVEQVLLVVGRDTAPFAVLEPLGAELGVQVEAVPEPEPLDTAGGVRAALDRLDGPTLVCNGDILTDVPFADVVDAHVAAGADATLVLTRVQDTSSFGVCVREGERIVDFVEKPAPGTLPGQDAVNAGTYVLDPAVLADRPQGRLSFERDVFPGLLAGGGHLHGYVWEGAWADLGTPQRYREGHRLALDGALRWPALDAVPGDGDGVRVAPDASVDGAELRGPVLVLPGARLGRGARVGPHVVVGHGCDVAEGAELHDVVLGAGTVVGAGALVSALVSGAGAVLGAGVIAGGDVVVGAGEVVPDGAVLEPGTRLPAPRG